MLLIVSIVIFEFISLAYVKIFLDQRAVLSIGRAIDFDIRNLVKMDSYKFYVATRFSRWIVLAIIFYLFGWKYPLALFVIEIIICVLCPVPNKSYKEAMHKFKIVSMDDASFEPLYEQAETALRSQGVPF